jgi:hypothetical protein
LALLLAETFSTLVPAPGADRMTGVNVAETPPGNPVTENETAALKPPLTTTFSVTLLFDPAVRETELAETVA